MAEMIAASLSARVATTLSGLAAVELSSLFAIRSGVTGAAQELEFLRVFIRFADSRRGIDVDELAAPWVNHVRDAAFELEDVADEYFFLSGRGFVSDCANFRAWFALSRRLRKARERLRELYSRERYNILPVVTSTVISDPSGGGGAALISRNVAETSYFMEEEEIVGFAAHKRLLMEWLTQDAEPRRMLVAVSGMGGVGKTTLATNVYKELSASGRHFDCAAWVAVSRTCTAEDLLRTVLKELHEDIRVGAPREADEMNYRSLVRALQRLLSNKRYLILLDDIWDPNAWYGIRNAFVDDQIGSRIIITTRDQDVASLGNSRIIPLKPLPREEAWYLFRKTTFREDADRECPVHLEQWASKILDKCDGLPLAIVTVGNLLALRPRADFAWRNLHDSIECHGIGEVSSILNLSIDYLPCHLKRCFLYCSTYPEDFTIKRKILIRMWIAEGFVEETRHATMEDVADDYLNRLVQHNLLQVVVRNEFGRAKRFKIHDLFRELIVRRSTPEGFFILSKDITHFESNRIVRHLTLDRCESGHFPPKMLSLRSLHAFKTNLGSSLLSRFRLLTVLNLWFVAAKKLPSAVSNLFNLRYIGIRSTLIKELPQEIGRLHKLQTLDAKWSMVETLPSSITNLEALRHLILFRRQGAEFKSMLPGKAVMLPYGIKNLNCLQTLKYIEADEKTIRSLGSLTHMRSLQLFGVHESSLVHLPSSINKMSHLICLGIASRNDDVQMDLELFSPPPLKLQKFTLKGRLMRGKLPSWFGRLSYLKELRLHSSELEEDSIVLLSALPRLFDLSLLGAYKQEGLTFATGAFPVLRKLSLQSLPNLAHLEFQTGSLVELRKLVLCQCAKLIEIPQGIENLLHLENLEVFKMPKLIEKINEEQESEGYHQNARDSTTAKFIREVLKVGNNMNSLGNLTL